MSGSDLYISEWREGSAGQACRAFLARKERRMVASSALSGRSRGHRWAGSADSASTFVPGQLGSSQHGQAATLKVAPLAPAPPKHAAALCHTLADRRQFAAVQGGLLAW